MTAYTSFAGTICTAARITCSSNGFPPTSCNTLGNRDLSLVPLPAAIMATAMRVAGDTSREEACAGEDFAGKDLPFDFFIRPNITRPYSNGYFLPHRLESLLGRQQQGRLARLQPPRGQHAQVRHRARHPEHRRRNPGPGHRHLAEILQRVEHPGSADPVAAQLRYPGQDLLRVYRSQRGDGARACP